MDFFNKKLNEIDDDGLENAIGDSTLSSPTQMAALSESTRRRLRDLKKVIFDFDAASRHASCTLIKLTYWLTGLTVVLAILTALLAYRSFWG